MFEQTFKNIDDILHKDAGCGSELDYVEQTSWVLFLKYLDDLEKDKKTAAELSNKTYTNIIAPEYDSRHYEPHCFHLDLKLCFCLHDIFSSLFFFRTNYFNLRRSFVYPKTRKFGRHRNLSTLAVEEIGCQSKSSKPNRSSCLCFGFFITKD